MNARRRYTLLLGLAVASYLAAALAANLLTDRFGMWPVLPGLTVTAGTYAAGLALFARDIVQRRGTIRYGHRGRYVALAAIPVAGALTWATTSAGLAVASSLAFLGAELVDYAVFTPVRERRGFATAVILSNVVAAPVDTWLFLQLAGFPITLDQLVGQFVGKVLYATLLPLAVWLLIAAGRRRRHSTLWDAINRDLGNPVA